MRVTFIILVGLLLMGVVVFFQIPAGCASRIIVDDADTIWNIGSDCSSDLITFTSDVSSRIITVYANSNFYKKLIPPDGFITGDTTTPPTNTNETKVIITIFIEDENGDPIPNAEVTIENNTVGITDINGKTYIEVTKNTDIKVRIVEHRYNTREVLIHIKSHDQTVTIKLQRNKGAPIIDYVGDWEIIGDNDTTLEEAEKLKITYSVTDEDGIKEIRFILDGAEIDAYFREGTYSTITDPLQIGKHVITLKAIDAAISPHCSFRNRTFQVKENINIHLHANRKTVKVGEPIILDLSAVHPLGAPPMEIQLILKVPSGMDVISAMLAESGAGQYVMNWTLKTGKMQSIILEAIPNQAGNYNIEGEIRYYFDDNESSADERREILHIQVNPKEEEMKDNNTPGFEASYFIIALVIIFYFIIKRRRTP